jgi:hypothetical protein
LLVELDEEGLFLSERSIPHAPAADNSFVADPPLREIGAMLAANRQRLHACGERLNLLERPFTELRSAARASALRAAGACAAPNLLLMAGHQPELFHPGVWVKNFALAGLARVHGAIPLNLVIDNDTVKTTALRLPAPPHVRHVLFDRWTGATPYEERNIADRALFAGFAERVAPFLRDWPYEPLLPALWSEVLRHSKHTSNLGLCLAAARHSFERAWGCSNFEVPLSWICDTEPFVWFAYHLLVHLPHFHSLYNTIVADYRRRHGIRDRQHPVPDLAVDGDWLEAPFWAWRAGAPRRERLFVRRDGEGLQLRAGAETWHLSARAEAAVKEWQELRNGGLLDRMLAREDLKIRSRALTTTLYARLFLADVFVHGIGGGKYDELTDELMRRFYQCEPPDYLVLSATLWLPLPRAAVSADDCRRLLHELRDVRYNPQRHPPDPRDADPAWDELAARKREWIARQPATRAERRQRFHVLRTLTEELRHPLRSREEQLRRQWLRCQHQVRDNAVLQRRDYSFCLYPESELRPFCTQFLSERLA